MKLKPKGYFLITAHRSENVDDPESLAKIFMGLEKIHLKFKKRVIYPIHPRTLSKIKKKIPKGIECIKPLGFFDFTKLEKNSFCLITDSGTVPEEALFFGVPCVTIRESTERPEYLEAGGNILSGLDPENLIESIKLITVSKNKLEWIESLGDNKTSDRVANILRGKNKPEYTPNQDCGDNLIIINADKVYLTGKKENEKIYYRHTGFPGGIKETTVSKMKAKNKSTDVIKLAIKRMIPKGPLGYQQMSNCKIFSGIEHLHKAQTPEILDISKLNNKNIQR